MPTPRAHGGAALQLYPLNLPGFRGLNKQARGSVLGPEWATRLENTVIDASNRIASRKGWTRKTTLADLSDDVVQMTEYLNGTTYELIAITADNAFWKSVDGGSSWTNVTAFATITDPNMQLVVLAGTLLGFQENGVIVTYSGTTLSDLGATGEPSVSGVALAAFGRVWAKDSAAVVKYCDLLDETNWTTGGAGSIDLTSVWKGQDEITALAEFNNALVIFGKRSIVVYTDGAGSKLGIDPEQIYVADIIGGIGCIARDSVANVKGDLWFLDDTGIHSLGRLVSERSNPLNNISANVQDELKKYVTLVDTANVRAVYSPRDRFYLLSLPLGSGTVENGVVFCFDTRGAMEDGAFRCAGIWNQMVPLAMVARDDFSLAIALRAHQGYTGTYSGYADHTTNYVLEYESGWTDLGEPTIKLVKRLNGLLFIQSATEVVFKWAFDFAETFKTATTVYPGSAGAAEFNIGEFNIGEFGGGVILREKKVGGKGSGEYIKIGMTINIEGDEVSCQQISLYAKQGRIA